MANLAIKGHKTRGKEVIEILEMLGGKSYTGLAYKGEDPDRYYCIDKETNFINASLILKEVQVFSLEEFFDKFPYKIGDKVKTSLHYANCIGTVKRMRWKQNENVIIYDVEWSDANKSTLTYYAQGLQLYKEETMDTVSKSVFDVNAQCCDIINHIIEEKAMEERENSVVVNIEHKQLKVHSLRFDKTQLVINDEYELKQEGNAYYIVRKKIQYPKTYEECCDVLELPYMQLGVVGYACEKLCYLQRLLLCRNAYWKICGDWEPDWNNINDKYCIYRVSEELWLERCQTRQCFLAFPTEEMRDAFLENFKELIEQCKELL